MPDPRISKLAQVLIRYSLNLQPGEQFLLSSNPLAHELTLAVYQEAVLSGAHVLVMLQVPGTREIFLKHANDFQLQFISPVRKLIYQTFDAELSIHAPQNLRGLSDVDPERLKLARQPITELTKIATARGEDRRLCITLFPTADAAQAAQMSLTDYEDFVYGAGFLHEPEPRLAWEALSKRQDRLIHWLAGKDQVVLSGPNIDLRLSIKDRVFLGDAGHGNFPGGEIFTSPVETSLQGWVRFSYPGFFAGQEIEDIQLWIRDGNIQRAEAAKGHDLLNNLLDTDPGARLIGEWGLGTNYAICQFTKNMLFDEKIGGTIHFAAGQGFTEAGGHNQSGLHWDMLCDMTLGEIVVDGALFYKNGEFVV